METTKAKGGRPKKILSPVTPNVFATYKKLVAKYGETLTEASVSEWRHPQGFACDSVTTFKIDGKDYSFKAYLQPKQADEETLKEKLAAAQEDAAWEKLRGAIVGTFGMFAFSLLSGAKEGRSQFSGSFADLQQIIPKVGIWAEGVWRFGESSLLDLGGEDTDTGKHMFAKFDRVNMRWEKVLA